MVVAPTRHVDGVPVYPRPRLGELSILVDCCCGSRFRGRVLGIQVTGVGRMPDVALVNCGCGSTRGYDVEPEAPR